MKTYFLIFIFLICLSGLSAQDKTLLFNENGLVYTVAIPIDGNRYEVKVIRRVNCDYFYWQINGDTLIKDSSGVFIGKKFLMEEIGDGYKIRAKGFFSKRIVLFPKSECDKKTIFILNKFEYNHTSKQIETYSGKLIGYPEMFNVYSGSGIRLTDSIMKNTCYSDMQKILEKRKLWAFAMTDSLYQAKVLKLNSIRRGQFDQTTGGVQKILCSLSDSDLDAEMLCFLILNHVDQFIQACVFMTESKYYELKNKFHVFPDDIDTEKLIETLNNSSVPWEKKDDYIKRLNEIARHTKRWNKKR